MFSVDDPPDDVIAMLNRAAAMLPQLRQDAVPSTVAAGASAVQDRHTVAHSRR